MTAMSAAPAHAAAACLLVLATVLVATQARRLADTAVVELGRVLELPGAEHHGKGALNGRR